MYEVTDTSKDSNVQMSCSEYILSKVHQGHWNGLSGDGRMSVTSYWRSQIDMCVTWNLINLKKQKFPWKIPNVDSIHFNEFTLLLRNLSKCENSAPSLQNRQTITWQWIRNISQSRNPRKIQRVPVRLMLIIYIFFVSCLLRRLIIHQFCPGWKMITVAICREQ